MRNRDESIAVKALLTAVEAQTEFMRHIATRVDSIDRKCDVLIDSLADHVATHHGDES